MTSFKWKVVISGIGLLTFLLISSVSVAQNTVIRCSFYRDLKLGDTGEDVLCLQKSFNSLGYLIAVSGPGSLGNETSYFGPLTQQAVSRWQAANGITPTAGYFGPISRNKYFANFSQLPSGTTVTGTTSGTTTTTTTTTGTTTPEPFDVTCEMSPRRPSQGDEIIFSVNIAGGKSPFKYKWSGDIGFEDGDSRTIKVIYDDAGKYEVRISVTDEENNSVTGVCANIEILDNKDDDLKINTSDIFRITKEAHLFDEIDAACKKDYGDNWEFALIDDEDEDYILNLNDEDPIFSNLFFIKNVPSNSYPFNGNICPKELSPNVSWPETDKATILEIKSSSNFCYSGAQKSGLRVDKYKGLCRKSSSESGDNNEDDNKNGDSLTPDLDEYIASIDQIVSGGFGSGSSRNFGSGSASNLDHVDITCGSGGGNTFSWTPSAGSVGIVIPYPHFKFHIFSRTKHQVIAGPKYCSSGVYILNKGGSELSYISQQAGDDGSLMVYVNTNNIPPGGTPGQRSAGWRIMRPTLSQFGNSNDRLINTDR